MTERMTAAALNKRRKKPVDREGPIQIDIVNWLRKVLPDECIVHHCKNEVNKRGWAIAKEQARATTMGAVKGFPDLLVLTYAGAVFFEVKAPKGYPSKGQKSVHAGLERLSYPVAVVRSIDDVRAALVSWGVGFVEK